MDGSVSASASQTSVKKGGFNDESIGTGEVPKDWLVSNSAS